MISQYYIMPPTRAPQLREDHLGTLEMLRVDGDHTAGSDRNRSADLHQTFVENSWERTPPLQKTDLHFRFEYASQNARMRKARAEWISVLP
jgi:hypothetical protein